MRTCLRQQRWAISLAKCSSCILKRQLDTHLRSGSGKPNGSPVSLVGLMKCAVTFVRLGATVL
jgi:hypothetical protein